MDDSTSVLARRYGELASDAQTVPLEYERLREQARDHLPDEAYRYVTQAAGTEDTMTENRRALDRYRIVPRVLRGISSVSLSTEMFGREISSPLLLAPIGAQEIYHQEGELASARAADGLNIPFALSTSSSHSIEDVADTAGTAPKIFQLYWHPEPKVTESYVERAEAAGYDAIMLTVDAGAPRWIPSMLEADRSGIESTPKAIPLSDPVVQKLANDEGSTIEEYVEEHELRIDATRTWDDIARLRDHTDLPILLKGILHPRDGKLAADHADGVVVSNHGGRQVDGQIGTAKALPAVVEEIAGEIPVVFDSGVRSGADVFKALALGADAVMVGRPYVLGLAIGGTRGVREVVENYAAELESILHLCGCESIADVDADFLVESDAQFYE